MLDGFDGVALVLAWDPLDFVDGGLSTVELLSSDDDDSASPFSLADFSSADSATLSVGDCFFDWLILEQNLSCVKSSN